MFPNSLVKIYVGNLAFATTRETLQGVFEEFGDVYDCYVPMDPNTMNPRGFAFVTMGRENGEDAISELDGLELDGRFIRVNEAQGKKKPSPSGRNDGGWYNDNGFNNDDDSGAF
jgi:cold-inducible RNA-binding protein